MISFISWLIQVYPKLRSKHNFPEQVVLGIHSLGLAVKYYTNSKKILLHINYLNLLPVARLDIPFLNRSVTIFNRIGISLIVTKFKIF